MIVVLQAADVLFCGLHDIICDSYCFCCVLFCCDCCAAGVVFAAAVIVVFAGVVLCDCAAGVCFLQLLMVRVCAVLYVFVVSVVFVVAPSMEGGLSSARFKFS